MQLIYCNTPVSSSSYVTAPTVQQGAVVVASNQTLDNAVLSSGTSAVIYPGGYMVSGAIVSGGIVSAYGGILSSVTIGGSPIIITSSGIDQLISGEYVGGNSTITVMPPVYTPAVEGMTTTTIYASGISGAITSESVLVGLNVGVDNPGPIYSDVYTQPITGDPIHSAQVWLGGVLSSGLTETVYSGGTLINTESNLQISGGNYTVTSGGRCYVGGTIEIALFDTIISKNTNKLFLSGACLLVAGVPGTSSNYITSRVFEDNISWAEPTDAALRAGVPVYSGGYLISGGGLFLSDVGSINLNSGSILFSSGMLLSSAGDSSGAIIYSKIDTAFYAGDNFTYSSGEIISGGQTFSGGYFASSQGSWTIYNAPYYAIPPTYVYRGGTAKVSEPNSGTLVLCAGVIARDIVISSGGTLVVSPGAVATILDFTPGSGAIIEYPGALVLHNPPLSGCFISKAVGDNISSSSFTDCEIQSGDICYVYSGGVLSGSTIVSSGGTLLVYSGGTGGLLSSSLYIQGSCIVYSGGVVGVSSHTQSGFVPFVFVSGGELTVCSGGVANGINWDLASGTLVVYSGTTYTLVRSPVGCTGKVISGTSEGSSFYSSGGPVTSLAEDQAWNVCVYSEGVLLGVTLGPSSLITISSGGLVSSIGVIQNRSIIVTSSIPSVVSSNGFQYIADIYVTSTIPDSSIVYPTLYVSDGGRLIRANLEQASVTVFDGGRTTSTYGGNVLVYSGGLIESAVVTSTVPYSLVGGTALYTSITTGALVVISEGYAENTKIDRGGVLSNCSGNVLGVSTLPLANVYNASGVLSGAVLSGGFVDGYGGLMADIHTVLPAAVFISSGTAAGDIFISSGGSLVLEPGVYIGHKLLYMPVNILTTNNYTSLSVSSGGSALGALTIRSSYELKTSAIVSSNGVVDSRLMLIYTSTGSSAGSSGSAGYLIASGNSILDYYQISGVSGGELYSSGILVPSLSVYYNKLYSKHYVNNRLVSTTLVTTNAGITWTATPLSRIVKTPTALVIHDADIYLSDSAVNISGDFYGGESIPYSGGKATISGSIVAAQLSLTSSGSLVYATEIEVFPDKCIVASSGAIVYSGGFVGGFRYDEEAPLVLSDTFGSSLALYPNIATLCGSTLHVSANLDHTVFFVSPGYLSVDSGGTVASAIMNPECAIIIDSGGRIEDLTVSGGSFVRLSSWEESSSVDILEISSTFIDSSGGIVERPCLLSATISPSSALVSGAIVNGSFVPGAIDSVTGMVGSITDGALVSGVPFGGVLIDSSASSSLYIGDALGLQGIISGGYLYSGGEISGVVTTDTSVTSVLKIEYIDTTSTVIFYSSAYVKEFTGDVGTMTLVMDVGNDEEAHISSRITLVSGAAIDELYLSSGICINSGGYVGTVCELGGYYKTVLGDEPHYSGSLLKYLQLTNSSASVHSNTAVSIGNVFNEGLLEVFSGGQATSVNVSVGGKFIAHSGAELVWIVETGGYFDTPYETLSSGVIGCMAGEYPEEGAIGIRLTPGNSCTVHSGTVFAPLIASSAIAIIHSSGLVTSGGSVFDNATDAWESFASDNVYGSVSITVPNVNATIQGQSAALYISGGTATYTDILDYAYCEVVSGGLFSSSLVGRSATALIKDGGIMKDCVTSDGVTAVDSSGLVRNLTVKGSKACLSALAGSCFLVDLISTGTAVAVSAGIISCGLASDGGRFIVQSGGTLDFFVVNDYDSGVAHYSGGHLIITSNPWNTARTYNSPQELLLEAVYSGGIIDVDHKLILSGASYISSMYIPSGAAVSYSGSALNIVAGGVLVSGAAIEVVDTITPISARSISGALVSGATVSADLSGVILYNGMTCYPISSKLNAVLELEASAGFDELVISSGASIVSYITATPLLGGLCSVFVPDSGGSIESSYYTTGYMLSDAIIRGDVVVSDGGLISGSFITSSAIGVYVGTDVDCLIKVSNVNKSENQYLISGAIVYLNNNTSQELDSVSLDEYGNIPLSNGVIVINRQPAVSGDYCIGATNAGMFVRVSPPPPPPPNDDSPLGEDE